MDFQKIHENAEGEVGRGGILFNYSFNSLFVPPDQAFIEFCFISFGIRYNGKSSKVLLQHAHAQFSIKNFQITDAFTGD